MLSCSPRLDWRARTAVLLLSSSALVSLSSPLLAQTVQKGTSLPDVPIVQGTASAKSAKKLAKPLAKPGPAASAQPQTEAVETPDAGERPGASGMAQGGLGVGAKGLAVPATSTTISGEALTSQLPGTSDTAELLKSAAGVAVSTSGGVSGLPVMNGMNDERVKLILNGMIVSSACPNHMNPALSYIDPTQVKVIDVISGVTPVSKGGDSLGGTVQVESAIPAFAAAGETLHTEGSATTFYRSNTNSIGAAGHVSAATQNVSIGYAGAWAQADDYERGDGGGLVRSTLYDSQNHAVTFAAKSGQDLLIVQGAYEYVPYQGYVNQRMDMTENEGKLVNGRYIGHFGWGLLDARAFFHDTHHVMDILADKKPGAMPMVVDGQDAGYSLKAEMPITSADVLRFGSEFHHQALDEVWPPVPGNMMMGPLMYVNMNDGSRDRLGTFLEWEHKWTSAWTTLIGARNDLVWMDTGIVQDYSGNNLMACMGMGPCDAVAARAFNALDRSRSDTNFDATALVRYEPTTVETYEIGFARKTRSPNLYERYAWGVGAMAAGMIGWYGDANGYIGNPDLAPEIGNTVSLTAGWHDWARQSWEFKVTPYYTYVQDYIDADFVRNQTNMMGMPNGFVTMRFANHDAELYGVNLSGSVPLVSNSEAGEFRLSGVIGYVAGENLDTGDRLYHMMPLNARLTLSHLLGGWSSAAEVVLVDEKSEVNALRREPVTDAYALLNLKTSYTWQNVRIDLGVDNVFDALYFPPLGGVDWADFKAGGQMGRIGAVPGAGRSFNAGVTVKF